MSETAATKPPSAGAWRRRLGCAFLVLVGLSIVAAVGAFQWLEGAGRADHKWENARLSAWNSLVGARVAIGETRQDAEVWLRAVAPPGTTITEWRDGKDVLLNEMVEKAQSTGLAIPCDAPEFVLSVRIGPDGRVISREARADTACL